MSKFLNELKRRNVIKATIAYLVVAWVLLQVFTVLLPIVDAPGWALKGITLILAIGLPIWIIVSWVYDITPQGIEKTSEDSSNDISRQATNKRLNAFIITSLSVAVVILTLQVTGVFSSKSNTEYAIAVLPFVNMSDDAEQEYFSDGISEEVINMLAQVPELKVMGRTSSFAFKGKNMDLKLIGEQLNVNYLLEGSVRRSGNTLRITAQLINVEDGSHLYSDTFDRELKDVFDIQDEISSDILNAVKVKLFGDKKESVFKKYTDNVEAYQRYLQGRFYLNKFSPNDLIKAVDYFDEAIAIDSTYAIAFADKAFCYMNLRDWGWLPEESESRAREAAFQSFKLDNKISESHLAVGRIKLHWDWNIKEAMDYFEKAIDINPNNAETLVQLGMCLNILGRNNEAIDKANMAENLDPLSVLNMMFVSIITWGTGDYEKLVKRGERMIELAPNFFGGHMWVGASNYSLGRLEDGLARMKTAAELDPTTYMLGKLVWVYVELGEKEKAVEIIQEMKDAGAETNDNYNLALACASVGDKDSAFHYFNKALELNQGNIIYTKELLKFFTDISDDPLAIELYNKIGIPYP